MKGGIGCTRWCVQPPRMAPPLLRSTPRPSSVDSSIGRKTGSAASKTSPTSGSRSIGLCRVTLNPSRPSTRARASRITLLPVRRSWPEPWPIPGTGLLIGPDTFRRLSQRNLPVRLGCRAEPVEGSISHRGHGYGNQALILKTWGRLDEALKLHKKEEAVCLKLGDKNGLQASYGNQALILRVWGRLDEALEVLKKKEAICLELGNKDSLQMSYGNQALILKANGRLDEALELLKKQDAICLELENKDSLQMSYGNQAVILKANGRLDEALVLHKKQEAICQELGYRDGLQVCYGNQALILQDWGRLDEALVLHKKQEAICLELVKQRQAFGIAATRTGGSSNALRPPRRRAWGCCWPRS